MHVRNGLCDQEKTKPDIKDILQHERLQLEVTIWIKHGHPQVSLKESECFSVGVLFVFAAAGVLFVY